jgi:hypothetical protein
MNRLFVDRKVLATVPWLLHELVTVSDNTRWNMLKSAVHRLLFPGGYLRTKYWPDVERSIPLYLRHGLDVLKFAGRAACRPGGLVEDLRVDRWMHSLEAASESGPGRTDR